MSFTQTIFVNLPVTSVKASEPFYEALGMTKNPNMCSEDTTCMVLSPHIFVMLLEPTRFQSFMPASKSLVAGRNGTEVLLCISAEKREDVDRMVEDGERRGGKKDPTTLPQMPGCHGRSVEDPDGHIWEIMSMEVPVLSFQGGDAAAK